MKTTSTKGARQRKLDVAQVTPKQKIDALVLQVYGLNRTMNAAKNSHDKARKELYAEMKALGMDITLVEGKTDEGAPIQIEAIIETPTGQAVSPHKLQALVPMDKFLNMVSVTQKAVTDEVGAAVLNQVLVPTKGVENVKVGLRK